MKEAPKWIEKILYPVNTFFEGVSAILNQGITFGDNIAAQIRTIQFVTSSTYDGTAANWDVLSFPRTLKEKSQGLILLQMTQEEDNYTPIEESVYVDWQENNGVIEIGLVVGLAASKTYTMKVMVI